MFCPKCGTRIDGNISFCPKCGTNLNEFKSNVNVKIGQQAVEPVINNTYTSNISVNSVVNTEPVNITNNININDQPTESKPNKSKRDLIILLVVVGAIVIAVVLFFVFRKDGSDEQIDNPNDDTVNNPIEDTNNILDSLDFTKYVKDYELNNSFTIMIESDFKNGEITKDEYIMQLAYSIYDFDKLDSKYKSTKMDYKEPVDLFEKTESMVDDLSADTLTYVLDKYLLNDVVWEVENDDTSEISMKKDFNYEITSVSNSKGVSKLSKVILSSNNNFLVFYTTDGFNAITDSQAKQIADFLETAVNLYKSKFNLDFEYSATFSTYGGPLNKVSKLLENNNIDDKYLNTAMPIYVIDTNVEKTNSSGYYSSYKSNFELGIMNAAILYCKVFPNGEKCDDILSSEENVKSSSTTYAFPYFVVGSLIKNFEDTKITLAHELFHHYQKYICGEGSYKLCTSSTFTTETLADYATSSIINVSSVNTNLNEHSAYYSHQIHDSLDVNGSGIGAIGYGAFVFSHNYNEFVSNGTQHLFNSMKQSGANAALTYLYNNSGGKYKDIMLKTAERVLTLDYSNKALIPYLNGNILYPKEYNNIEKEDSNNSFDINYSSMNYFYVKPSDYAEKSQLTFNGSSSNLSIILFVMENNKYKCLNSFDLDKEFVININDFGSYQEIAFAIVNSEISGTLNYSIELDNDGAKIPTVTVDDMSDDTLFDGEYVTTFNNYEIEIEMDISVSGITTNSVSKGVVDELHQKEYLDVTTTSMGMVSVSNEIYTDFNTGMSYATQPYGGDVWYKSKSTSQMVDLGVILDKLKSMKNVTEISSNHFKVKMSPNDVKGLMASGNASSANIKGDVYVEVYTNNGYITKLEYDFTDLVKGFDSFTSTIKFSNYNKAGDVVIPQSVIKNAKNQ